jgi:hypothetical protein
MEFDTLYKYRNWKTPHHPATLRENQLYFTSPEHMNDPFDYKIPLNFFLLNTDAKLYTYIDACMMKLDPAQINAFGGKDNFRELKFKEFKSDPSKMQRDYESLYFPITDRHFGLLCFSHTWESILMRSHYADRHFGFCLGFHKKAFTERFNEGSLGYVRYDDFPNIDPSKNEDIVTYISQSHIKHSGWAYEEEFRLVRVEYPSVLSDNQRIYLYPDDFLKDITLGLRITEDDRAEIIGEGLRKHVPVYQVEKVPLSFKLSRRQLTTEELGKYQ